VPVRNVSRSGLERPRSEAVVCGVLMGMAWRVSAKALLAKGFSWLATIQIHWRIRRRSLCCPAIGRRERSYALRTCTTSKAVCSCRLLQFIAPIARQPFAVLATHRHRLGLVPRQRAWRPSMCSRSPAARPAAVALRRVEQDELAGGHGDPSLPAALRPAWASQNRCASHQSAWATPTARL